MLFSYSNCNLIWMPWNLRAGPVTKHWLNLTRDDESERIKHLVSVDETSGAKGFMFSVELPIFITRNMQKGMHAYNAIIPNIYIVCGK